jgi:hypothetical protein
MLEQDPQMRAHLDAAHRRHAALHGGFRVAASGDSRHVKCLHAHLAFALAEGGSPVGDWIMEHGGITWPGGCCPDLPAPEGTGGTPGAAAATDGPE